MKIEVSHFGAALAIGLLETHIAEVRNTEWSEKGIMTKDWYIAQVQGTVDALKEATDKQMARTKKRYNG